MKKKEFSIKTIFTWLRSKQGKRYSFFVFYFFFFIFLFIYLRVIDNSATDTKEIVRFPYQISLLESNNYSFQYTLLNDLSEEDYLVEKNGVKVYVKDDQGIVEYTYSNGILTTDDDRIPYSTLLNIFELKRVIKSSILVTETKIKTTEETVYNYTITNKELASIFNKELISNTDLENTFSIKASSEKKIKEIKFDLLNYQKSISNHDYNKFELVFNYEDSYE